jgi:Glycosidases
MRNFEIDFSVSSAFVSPLFPEPLSFVDVSVYISGDYSRVALRADNDQGLFSEYEMKGYGDYRTARVKTLIKGEKQHFHFIVESEGEVWYFSKKGVTSFIPNKHDSFLLLSGLEAPDWIAGATCYQIFPDRFNNGNPSLNVKDGAYEFDGGVVSSHSFDEIPEEYEKSRCLDFFNGDLKGIEDKIDYLKDLGITCLYLNPINSSLTVHRYDSIDFFSVDEKLGGDEALASLIAKCHENGIRVVVDISINHTGANHPWFLKAKSDPESEEAGFYYKEGADYRYWQGVKTLPQLNYNSEKLRQLIYKGENSVLKKYLRAPFCQDGWRLDVAPELGRTERQALTKEVWREVRKEVKSINGKAYLVGEDWGDATEYLEGDMWDATMNYFGSGRILRRWMGEADRFLCCGWGHDPGVCRPYTGDEVADAVEEGNADVPDQLRFFQMNLIDSHDTPRLENDEKVFRKDLYKGAVSALYFLPGFPSVYYGDEVNLAGRMGSVEGSRYPMEWKEEKWDMEILSHYRALGALRKEYNSLFACGATKAFGFSLSAFGLLRYERDRALLLIATQGDREETIEFEYPFLSGWKAEVLMGNANVELIDDCYEITVKKGENPIILFKK